MHLQICEDREPQIIITIIYSYLSHIEWRLNNLKVLGEHMSQYLQPPSIYLSNFYQILHREKFDCKVSNKLSYTNLDYEKHTKPKTKIYTQLNIKSAKYTLNVKLKDKINWISNVHYKTIYNIKKDHCTKQFIP